MTPAVYIINKFGGLTRTATAIDLPVTTVQGWKDRGRIPQEHWFKLIDAAAAKGETLALADFLLDHDDDLLQPEAIATPSNPQAAA